LSEPQPPQSGANPLRPFAVPVGPTAAAADAHDWAATPLGPRENWPVPLQTAAGIALRSNIPMLIGWGPDLTIIHNDSYGEILGDRRPALGRPLREIWADIWEIVGPSSARVMAGETVFMESAPRPLKRQGKEETAWITSAYHPILDEDGHPAGILGVVIAVNRDEVSQERLRESEERFRLIADSAPVPMWVTRLDRKRSFVNRAYVEFLGITYEEAVDFDWRQVLHPDDFERIVAESLAGEASMKRFALEARFHRGDGEWRWLRSVSQPRWGPGGEHVGFIGIAHDITEWKFGEATLRGLNEALEKRVEKRTADLKDALDRLQAEVAERERAEEALRQAQKMEAVGRLTGGIAHDFNNLLTPVIGGLEILASHVEEPRLKRLAEAALESSRRGAKLTGQLLAFSRLQRIGIAPVPVNRVIEDLRQILKHTIGPDIAILTELAAGALHASCDENQLENAILNLAINARDAMTGGGTLTIRTALTVEPGDAELAPGDYVSVTVADTGSGMRPDVLARAFEPFFSTKPLGKGTGLGLAQVYGIARQSGGTVRIESREGEGTAVHILLPRAEARAETMASDGEAEAVSAVQRPAGARIVIVDDDADVRLFLGDLLDDLGHEVAVCEDAAAAITAMESGLPDLVLIDYAMPGMNGAELARILRSRYPDLRIAFVTGYAESDQLDAAVGAEAPILRKPFGLDALSALVADALRDRESASKTS